MPTQSPTLPDRLIGAGDIVHERFDDLRSSATHSRDLVDPATREGPAAAPLLGHGWPGDPGGSDWERRL